MRSNALYFPFIDVPNSRWVIRTLLYWDKLSSIVPTEFVVRPGDHSEFMQNLLAAELVEQVFPSHYVWQVEGFEETFIRYLESKQPMLSSERPDSRNLSKVHVQKMGELAGWLVENELAERDGYSWLYMSDSIAGPFMTYLACVLGKFSEVNAAPITDNRYLANYFKVYNETNTSTARDSAQIGRDYILEQLLPVPEKEVSLDELVLFKSKYGELLPPLREKIELYVSEISSIPDTEHRNARKEIVAMELKDELSAVKEAMSFSFGKFSFGVVTPLVGAGGTVYSTDVSENAIAAGAAGFSFLAALYSSISMIENQHRATHSPMGYLAKADAVFGEKV